MPSGPEGSDGSAPRFDIVISYRREDSQGTSNALYRELVRRFGADRVLLDITSVPVGADYDQFVRGIIARAKAVIVVIGPEWLRIEKQGKRRLDREDDPVRGEVLAAFGANIPLIPLLVDGASAPEPDALPPKLAHLARLNMMPISERHWDADIETLVKQLSTLLPASAPAAAPAAPRRATRIWIPAVIVLVIGIGVASWLQLSPSPVKETPEVATKPPEAATKPAEPAIKSPEVAKTPEAAPAKKASVMPAPDATPEPAAEPGTGLKPAPPPAQLTAAKVSLAQRALAIVVIHESGRPPFYNSMRYNTKGELEYGYGIASLQEGSLAELLNAYATTPGARFARGLKPYLARVDARDVTLAREEAFRKLLRSAGQDPVMTRLQESLASERVVAPSRRQCERLGVKSRLGEAMFADVITQSGLSRFNTLSQRTTTKLGGTPGTGVDEHQWLEAFAAVRIEASSTQSFADEARRRMETFQALMREGNWDLAAPITLWGYRMVDP